MSELKVLQMTVPANDPVGFVEIVIGDGADLDASEQWITARLKIDAPELLSFLRLQGKVLEQMQSLTHALSQEIMQRTPPTFSDQN
jgi:hypothetical protein